MSLFRRLTAAEGGSILAMAAMALTVVMGMTGLAVEVGNGYATKVRNQRVADTAALGAAMAYKANNNEAQAIQTAKDIVTASGLSASTATIAKTSVNGTDGMSVQITTAVPVRIASVLTKTATYNVTTTGIASLGGAISPGCFVSLDKNASYGVHVTGASKINTTGCSVSSNSPISVEGSSNITAATITGPTITTTGTSTVTGTKNIGANASDPLSGNAVLAAAFAQIGKASASLPTAPSFPSGTTTADWTFPANTGAYNGLAASDPVKTNCSISGKTITCKAGTYNINNMTVPSGITVTFSGTTVVNVYGTFSANGATLNGTATKYNLKNSFTTGWSTAPTFGDIGGLYVGGAVTYTGSDNKIGSGDVYFAGGLSVGGSSVLTIGAGTHSFAGTVDIGGSGSLTIGAGNLVVTGDFNVGGSASVAIGAGNQQIGGNMTLNGGATLGAGRYTITGNFVKSASMSATATGVTIIAGGSFTTGGSASLTLTAPASDDLTGTGAIGGIAFASKTTLATSVDGSSSNTLAGIFYIPNSDLSVTGAGAVATSVCTSFVVKTASVSGSAQINDTGCTTPVVVSSNAIGLIQ